MWKRDEAVKPTGSSVPETKPATPQASAAALMMIGSTMALARTVEVTSFRYASAASMMSDQASAMIVIGSSHSSPVSSLFGNMA